MSTQDQARALMLRHRHLIKNREQCMLSRAAAELGMPSETANYWNHIQGKPHPTFSVTYDRSGASFS